MLNFFIIILLSSGAK